MGQHIGSILSSFGRFFEYPVKRKPICFFRQEDFSATAERHCWIKGISLAIKLVSHITESFLGLPTDQDNINKIHLKKANSTDFSIGEPHRKTGNPQKAIMNDYDKLVENFYTRLAEQRQYNQEMKEKDRRWSMQKVVERFPGWNEVTISNLHSLFLLFDNQANGMLGFDDFGAVLESLGDESETPIRKEKFTAADTDNDGLITYDEFLSLVYNFNPADEGRVTGLAAMCNDVAENIQFVSNLTVGEQLEYGLF